MTSLPIHASILGGFVGGTARQGMRKIGKSSFSLAEVSYVSGLQWHLDNVGGPGSGCEVSVHSIRGQDCRGDRTDFRRQTDGGRLAERGKLDGNNFGRRIAR